jgi:hypothetical protein
MCNRKIIVNTTGRFPEINRWIAAYTASIHEALGSVTVTAKYQAFWVLEMFYAKQTLLQLSKFPAFPKQLVVRTTRPLILVVSANASVNAIWNSEQSFCFRKVNTYIISIVCCRITIGNQSAGGLQCSAEWQAILPMRHFLTFEELNRSFYMFAYGIVPSIHQIDF